MAGAKRTEAKRAGAEPAMAALRMARAMRGVPGAASAWLRGQPAAVRDSTRLRAVRLWSSHRARPPPVHNATVRGTVEGPAICAMISPRAARLARRSSGP